MNKKITILFFLFFFLSRILFINTQGVFFDSNENIDLFSYSNFLQAIVSGHFPPHEGYIILFWPVFHLASFLNFNPVYTVILGQILLAALTIFCFYRIVYFISDKRTAILAACIASLAPLFWITNVTIMMEIAYISFFFFSLYFLIQYLSTSKKSIYLHISALCFTLSFLSHMLIALWLPLYLAIVFYKRKEVLLKTFLTISVYLATFSILNVVFISAISQESLPAVFRNLYLTKGNEFAYLPSNIHGFLIAMRNFLIPLLRNNTILIAVIGFISLIVLFTKNKTLFILGLLWIIPAAYTNQWWDSLLNGRHALITNFGLAFLTAYLLRKKMLYASFVIVYLLFVSIPTVNLLKKPIPYLKEADFAKTLPKDSLFIETHFAKPQVEKTFQGKLLAVNNPLSPRELIQKEIDRYLLQKKPVFISSGALSEPYGLYSGPYLHNITLSYAKTFSLDPIITKYTLTTYKELSTEDNLIIYKIETNNPSPYPEIKKLKNSYRRIDSFDPFWQIISYIFENKYVK